MLRRITALVLLGWALSLFAFQNDGEIVHVVPQEAVEGSSLYLEALYTGDMSQIQSAKVLYRLAGQVGYLEEPMEIGELKLTANLPGEIIGAPGIEYVIVLSMRNGGLVAFPTTDDPLSEPQYVPVSEPATAQDATETGSDFGDLIILTPDPATVMPFGEKMIVAASLFNLSNVDINSVRIFFDNVDVSAYSLVTTDLITYKPDVLSPGKHTIFIEVSNIYGVRLASTSWSFTVRSQAQQIFEVKINGNLNLSHRNDLINTSLAETDTIIGTDTLTIPVFAPETQTVSRADFSTNINFDWAKIKLFGNLTTKEDSTLQPQNRYGVKVRTSWLKYTYGDDTPMMNKLALWGKRVRGHNIDLRFKWVNLQVVTGQTARAITGSATFDSTGSQWKRSGYSFERGLFAIRPSIGSGKYFQMGLFYVHSRDSVNSVSIRPTWWDETTFAEELTGPNGIVPVPFGADSYTLGDSVYAVNYYLNGSNPEDNIVVGSDVKFALDNHRFVLEGSAAFSLYNRNIIDGPLTRSQLDTFGLLSDTTYDDTMGSGTLDMALSTIDDMVSNMGMDFLLSDGKFDPGNLADYFILNENLTLPIDVENITNGNILAGMTSLALHFGAKFNYYGNFIHADYYHVGPGYKALGSPVLRLDSKGWSGWKVTDKIRLLNNMLYFNLGWESYKNNTTTMDLIADPRLAQDAFNGGITLNPGRGLPTVTTSIKYFTRDNNIDDTTHTIQTLASGMDTIIVIDNRELNESLSSNVNLTYLVKLGQLENTISFNMMRSNMDNMVIGKEGLLRASNLYGLNLRTEWGIPLTTTLAIRNNENQLYVNTNPNYQSNTFSTYRVGAGYRLFGGHLILRSNLQYMTFSSEKYDNDQLVTTLKTQANTQLNAQYTFRPVTIGSTTVGTRIITSYEQRNYVSDYSNYTDNTVSARLEMTF